MGFFSTLVEYCQSLWLETQLVCLSCFLPPCFRCGWMQICWSCLYLEDIFLWEGVSRTPCTLTSKTKKQEVFISRDVSANQLVPSSRSRQDGWSDLSLVNHDSSCIGQVATRCELFTPDELCFGFVDSKVQSWVLCTAGFYFFCC